MRAAYHLALAVFSVGTVAMPTTAPNATHQAERPMSANQQYAFLVAAHNIVSDASFGGEAAPGTNLASHFSRGAIVGETLSEDVELHLIPRHETYRYAVVNDQRVIVDAASRRIVYVVR
ncbi:DUF1236 domain-containing protein [Microvirga splendida]|uniref:DUF1236 domain-containing protein n=1 Tax=Microvirga splendida TaxID=2795727 RepID=A0ABS0XUY1_9HYPH|nr:DUF1236 domain-containing protein [Microvirga splendida]MBJ6123844.1 DUF1236 domain-containing protein [Microvirga splendida]